MSTLLKRLVSDESGTETIEYALVLGLVIVGAIGAIAAVGPRVIARWNVYNDGI